MELNSLLTVLITVAVLTFGMYLTITVIARSYFEKQQWDIRIKNTELITPLRLQAYERMCLFLERITPNNLIIRLSGSAEGASEFQQLLLHEIRSEYNHNLAQQLYISHDAWETVNNAMQEVVSLINQSAEKVGREATATELSRQIFQQVLAQDRQSTAHALKTLKTEIQTIF